MLQHCIRVFINDDGMTADCCHYDGKGNLSGQEVLGVTDDLAVLFNGLAGVVPEPAVEAEPAPKKKRASKKEK